MKTPLHLREQSMVLVSLAATFLILTILKTRHSTTGEVTWMFFKKPTEKHLMQQQNKLLISRSVMLLLVASIALVINVVKVPKVLRTLLNLAGGLVVVAAGLATLLDFYDKPNKKGTLNKLKSKNAYIRTAGIVGTVAGGVAILTGASHLIEGCRAL